MSGITALEHSASVSLEAIPSLLQRGKSLARLPMEQVEGMEPSVLPLHVAHAGWHLGTRSQVWVLPLRPPFLLWVCSAASTAGKACGDSGNNREYVKVAEELGCLGVMQTSRNALSHPGIMLINK